MGGVHEINIFAIDCYFKGGFFQNTSMAEYGEKTLEIRYLHYIDAKESMLESRW